MIDQRTLALPAKEMGLWLDCSDHAATRAGCKVCDWTVVGEYAAVRAEWLAHSHDPLCDIEARWDRLTDGNESAYNVLLADVAYLLDVITDLKRDQR